MRLPRPFRERTGSLGGAKAGSEGQGAHEAGAGTAAVFPGCEGDGGPAGDAGLPPHRKQARRPVSNGENTSPD